MKKLGFGMMRLPKKAIFFDMKQIKEMVDLFMENGFTYFDTAYVYPGSEKATRKALVERYPRDSYTIATKMYALPGMPEPTVKREFRVSLRQLGVQFIDYYLLHSLMDSNYKKYDKQKIWEFAAEQKQQGRISHLGFSYHSGPELLDRILTDHPETEFVQLQINYMDWEDEKIASRKNYEVARAHNVPIVVMEPVKGGKLANPPKDVKRILLEADCTASYASWAMRFAANLPGVMTVLSGMSNLEQMQDNISYMKDLKPFTEEEKKILAKAGILMQSSEEIPCTDCKYCVKGCPKKIMIPNIFKAMNETVRTGASGSPADTGTNRGVGTASSDTNPETKAHRLYNFAVAGAGKASDCIGCGACESVCPQHIEIVEKLKEAGKLFD